MRRNKGKSSFPASSLTPRSPSPSTYSNQVTSSSFCFARLISLLLLHACVNYSRIHATMFFFSFFLPEHKKKKNNKKKKIYIYIYIYIIVSFSCNINFTDLFTGAKVRNTILYWLHNIYQHQS
jgi:hypothetical protein